VVDIVSLKDVNRKPIGSFLVLGQVVGVHIDEAFVRAGRLDTAALQPIARCGYADYAVVDELFVLTRPT
jgi:flavin reductase (DIM6/NTAB) family NADH-FMN oxidoreductase RutF